MYIHTYTSAASSSSWLLHVARIQDCLAKRLAQGAMGESAGWDEIVSGVAGVGELGHGFLRVRSVHHVACRIPPQLRR